jgi:hypothetical protein
VTIALPTELLVSCFCFRIFGGSGPVLDTDHKTKAANTTDAARADQGNRTTVRSVTLAARLPPSASAAEPFTRPDEAIAVTRQGFDEMEDSRRRHPVPPAAASWRCFRPCSKSQKCRRARASSAALPG